MLKTCFVISPIGDKGSPERSHADMVLDGIVRPAAESSGFQVVRADELKRPGSITVQIIEHLLTADVVVAVLTGQNANVFYELAVRHSAGLPVVQLIAEGERIPFDVHDQRTIIYGTGILEGRRAEGELAAQLSEIETGHARSAVNPVTLARSVIIATGDGEVSDVTSLLLDHIQQVLGSIQTGVTNIQHLLYKQAGFEPRVIEALDPEPSKEELRQMYAEVREILMVYGREHPEWAKAFSSAMANYDFHFKTAADLLRLINTWIPDELEESARSQLRKYLWWDASAIARLGADLSHLNHDNDA